MYNTQWKCDINKNVLKIILLMKEDNKKAKYADISILLWFYLPPAPETFVLAYFASVQPVKKLQEN